MCNNAPNKQCSLSRADKPKLTTCMLVSHIPVPLPSFPSLAVQAIAQLPIACSTDHHPASHRLQYRPSPSFPSLAVQALTQLPVACSKLGEGLGARLYASRFVPVPLYPGCWWTHQQPGYKAISTQPSATCSTCRSQKWWTISFSDFLSVSVERAVEPRAVSRSKSP